MRLESICVLKNMIIINLRICKIFEYLFSVYYYFLACDWMLGLRPKLCTDKSLIQIRADNRSGGNLLQKQAEKRVSERRRGYICRFRYLYPQLVARSSLRLNFRFACLAKGGVFMLFNRLTNCLLRFELSQEVIVGRIR